MAAELRINLYSAASDGVSEDYILRAVSTPISTLVTGGSGLTAIYDDLGDGPVYGGRTVAVSESGFITVPLNATFVAALTSGGSIALGGQITSSTPGGAPEYLFGGSAGSAGDVQLLLSVAPTHAPIFQLQITFLPPNALQVSWPVTPDAWLLQSSPSLSSPLWTLVPDAPVIIGGQNVVVLPATDGQLFFRLMQAP